MLPENRDAAYLWDILQAARDILGFISGLTFEQFAEDKRTRFAVERQLLAIGEAEGKSWSAWSTTPSPASCVRGQSACLNDLPIRVSSRRSLSEAFVAVAYAADEEDIRKGIALLQRSALSARRAVANFAPALDLCNIARGRLDGLIDNGSTPEDHAAGPGRAAVRGLPERGFPGPLPVDLGDHLRRESADGLLPVRHRLQPAELEARVA